MVLEIGVPKELDLPVRLVADAAKEIARSVEFRDIEEGGTRFIEERLTGNGAAKAAGLRACNGANSEQRTACGHASEQSGRIARRRRRYYADMICDRTCCGGIVNGTKTGNTQRSARADRRGNTADRLDAFYTPSWPEIF
ncbi:hypothetical protein D3C71_1684060 [compost metagenome]